MLSLQEVFSLLEQVAESSETLEHVKEIAEARAERNEAHAKLEHTQLQDVSTRSSALEQQHTDAQAEIGHLVRGAYPHEHGSDGETGAGPLGVSAATCVALDPTPAPGLTQPVDLVSLSLASRPESPHSTASTSTTSLGSWVVIDDDIPDVASKDISAEKSASCLDSESLRRHTTCPLFSTRMSDNTAALLRRAERPESNVLSLQRVQTQLESRIETQIVPAAVQPMPPFAPLLPTRRITVAPSMPSTSSPPIARQMQAMMAS